MSRTSNVTTVTTFTGYPHGFTVGQVIDRTRGLTPDANFVNGTFTVASIVDEYTFTYSEVGANAVLVVGGYMHSTSGDDIQTDDEAAPGGWMVSDEGNPDSVPAVIPETSTGDRYKRTLRLLPLGSSLFFLKEDGLYRLAGDSPSTYTVECVDSTVTFVAADVAFTMGSRAFALTTQGLMTWTENSEPVPASVPIESDLRALVDSARTNVEALGHALAHDSKRRAYLWLPTSATDSSASVAYVYNALADAWTRWTRPAAAAIVLPQEDRLYVAPPEDGTTGLAPAVLRERNTGTSADYQDENGEAIQATLVWTPHFSPDVNSLEQLVYATYHFAGSTPTEMDVRFETDWASTGPWFTLDASASQSPGTFTTPPTLEQSRGRYHKLHVRHGVVGEPLRMLGYSAQVRYWTSRIP